MLYVPAGDSRAIIIQKGGKTKVMSIDHRPERLVGWKFVRRIGFQRMKKYISVGKMKNPGFGN